MSSRRTVLGLAGGVLAATAGCISAPTAAVSGGDVPESGQTRGEADPVSVERMDAGSDYEHVPSNDTVKYPATTSGGEVDEYGYVSFEEWGDLEDASVAASAVRNRLDTAFESIRQVSVAFGGPEGEPLRVSVSYRTALDESGDVIREPTMSVPALVDETPRSVTATVHFAGKTATNSYPVYVNWDAGATRRARGEQQQRVSETRVFARSLPEGSIDERGGPSADAFRHCL